jgi:hypothetical protein
MPRSSAQSDFVFTSGETDGAAADAAEMAIAVELEQLPPAAQPVALPKATLRTRFASARATKWVMGFTFFVLAILVIMTIVGPHIPSGE